MGEPFRDAERSALSRVLVVLGVILGISACATSQPDARVEAPSEPASHGPAEPSVPPRASSNGWCPAVKGITDDPAGDLTGRANDEARVLRIKTSIEWSLIKCPGVVGVGVTIAEYGEAMARGGEIRPTKVAADDKTYVIQLSITEARYMPKTNPLFFDGVRLYFDLSGPIEPL
jgi:hypothetical protein